MKYKIILGILIFILASTVIPPILRPYIGAWTLLISFVGGCYSGRLFGQALSEHKSR